MKNAVIYCRVSTQAQKDDGTSLDSQAESCIAYANKSGFSIVRTLSEVYSGAYFHDRPLLNEMRDGIRRGLYQVIVFHAIDRLSRNVAHLAILSDECERYGVEMHCVTEDFDRSAEGTLLRSVKAYTAEIEREKIRERTLRGRRTKAENGRLVCGMSPYGYSFNKDTYHREIVESEAEVIREIYRLAIAGNSSYSIQNILNEAAVEPPSRKPGFWHHTAVLRILTNDIYYGASHAFRYQKITQTVRGKRRSSSTLRARKDWIDLPVGTTPAIVTEQEFTLVKTRIESNRRNLRRGAIGNYLLRQRVICGVCGRKMRGETVGTNWKAYRCVSHVPQLQCDNSSLNALTYEPLIWNKLSEILYQPSVVQDILDQAMTSDHRKIDLVADLKTRETAVLRCERELNKLADRIGSVSDEVWDAVKGQLESKSADLANLKCLRDDAQVALKNHSVTEFNIGAFEQYIAEVRLTLGQLSAAEKVSVVEALNAKVLWNKGEIKLSISLSPLYSSNRLELVYDDSKRVDLTL